jgi:predicted O-methyltransferase YrrM
MLVALWTEAENIERARARLKDAGADGVVTRFADALRELQAL